MTFTWGTITAIAPLRVQLDGDTAPLPFAPDSLIDPATLAVPDRLRVELSGRRVVIHGRSGGSGDQPGDVKMTARATASSGWLLCRGQSLLRSAYPALFNAIGTTYGAADSTHFSIPNPPGRSVVGLDPLQTEFNTLGEVGGEKAHTLTTAEMPSHKHTDIYVDSTKLGWGNYGTTGGNKGVLNATASSNPVSTGTEGGGGSHNNLPPYIVFNFVIKI